MCVCGGARCWVAVSQAYLPTAWMGRQRQPALPLGQEAQPGPGPTSSFCISSHILAFLG